MGKKSQSRPQVFCIALPSGEACVLPEESVDDLETLEEQMIEKYQPRDLAERFVIDQMIHARWKLARLRRLETQAYADRIDDDGSDSHILELLGEKDNILEKLERMAFAQDRAHSKAVREFNQLRALARKADGRNEPNFNTAAAPVDAPVQNEPNPVTPVAPDPPPLPNEPIPADAARPHPSPVQNEPNPANPAPGHAPVHNEPNAHVDRSFLPLPHQPGSGPILLTRDRTQ